MKNAVEVNKDKLDNPEVKLKNGLEVLHLYDIHIETRSLYLVGEINDMSFRQTLKNLHYLDSLNNDPINFHICSEGGLLDYAYSLYDHMQSINSPTNTIGSGFICSAAVILLICGTNKRMATETSSVMLHPAESQVSGNVEHMEANKNMLSLSEEVRYNLFAKHTRWPAAKWKKKEREKREIWFSPKEMLSMGMIDEIVKNVPVRKKRNVR